MQVRPPIRKSPRSLSFHRRWGLLGPPAILACSKSTLTETGSSVFLDDSHRSNIGSGPRKQGTAVTTRTAEAESAYARVWQVGQEDSKQTERRWQCSKEVGVCTRFGQANATTLCR